MQQLSGSEITVTRPNARPNSNKKLSYNPHAPKASASSTIAKRKYHKTLDNLRDDPMAPELNRPSLEQFGTMDPARRTQARNAHQKIKSLRPIKTMVGHAEKPAIQAPQNLERLYSDLLSLQNRPSQRELDISDLAVYFERAFVTSCFRTQHNLPQVLKRLKKRQHLQSQRGSVFQGSNYKQLNSHQKNIVYYSKRKISRNREPIDFQVNLEV